MSIDATVISEPNRQLGRKRFLRSAVAAGSIALIVGFAIMFGLASDKADTHPMKEFTESPAACTMVAGAFALLAALIVPVLTDTKTENSVPIVEEDSEARRRAATVTDTRVKLQVHNTIQELKKDVDVLKEEVDEKVKALAYFKSRAKSLRDLAIHLYAFQYSFYVLIWMGLLTAVAAAIQLVINAQVGDYDQIQNELLRLLAMYASTIFLCCAAFGVSLYFIRRYVRKTKNLRLKYKLLIGPFGILLTGAIAMFTVSPALLAYAWPSVKADADEAFYSMPIISEYLTVPVPLLVYITASRLLLFPACGALAVVVSKVFKVED